MTKDRQQYWQEKYRHAFAVITTIYPHWSVADTKRAAEIYANKKSDDLSSPVEES